ncbi:hypothetical protein EF902_32480 [Streptomyces sp. WAC05858]|nr:hypothetical protein EF902_32480 [Streptomyces sp. WAC05858]
MTSSPTPRWASPSASARRNPARGFVPLPAPSRNRGSAPDPGPQSPDGLISARPAIEDTPEGRPGFRGEASGSGRVG